MKSNQYVFGPLPSRRLGQSVGISPIPGKACNYSCVYCQLGRTNLMNNEPTSYFPVSDILAEWDAFQEKGIPYDAVTVVGEGEPTLSSDLKELIVKLKERQEKPVCVITNSANIDRKEVREALLEADIVLPTIDTVNEKTWRAMHRPAGSISFPAMMRGLEAFAKEYEGELWLEVMLVKGMNDSKKEIDALKPFLAKLNADRIYINTPVRPPAEDDVAVPDEDELSYAVETLGGIALDRLTEGFFYSAETDPMEAILTIITRHPMTVYEITHLLNDRGITDTEEFFTKLEKQEGVSKLDYKGMISYLRRDEK